MKGRWPANIILDGSDEVVEMFPKTKSCIRPPTPDNENDGRGTWQMVQRKQAVERGHNDSGYVARFFIHCPYTEED